MFVCILIVISHDGDYLLVLLNLLLNNARPGDASAATKSTKGGNEGRKHLGGPVIHIFVVTIL